jgi:pimeloyl-ACP methyl ester carboxylesterase
MSPDVARKGVLIPAGEAALPGDLAVPADPAGIVLFVHGSGSSRHSVRNRHVAAALNAAGFATLLFDLLSEEEDEDPAARFDIDLLTTRLLAARRVVAARSDLALLRVGYFGASTGAAAALRAAAVAPGDVAAVVSRGGRPDMAGEALALVHAPTLLIVGGDDPEVLELNREAYAQLECIRQLAVVPGATHLFEEPGTLEQVSTLACSWFVRHLAGARAREP